MASLRRTSSGIFITGQGVVEHTELLSLTGDVDIQLIDGTDFSGRTFLDLAVLSGRSRESTRVERFGTGVYLAMTGSGIVTIGLR